MSGKINWKRIGKKISLLLILCHGLNASGYSQNLRLIDSLQTDLVDYYKKTDNVGLAIQVLKESSKDTSLPNFKRNALQYQSLLKQNAQLLQTIDSLKWAIALLNMQEERYEVAEPQLMDLLKSDYAKTRIGAQQQLKKLIHERSKDWTEKYPFNTIVDTGKPILAIGGLLFLVLFIPRYCYNRQKNSRRIRLDGNDPDELKRFNEAFRIIYREVQHSQATDQQGITFFPSGKMLLPFILQKSEGLESDAEQLIASFLPGDYSQWVKFLWYWGYSPEYSIEILSQEERINVSLFSKKTIIRQWSQQNPKGAEFDFRLDVAYQAILDIQEFMRQAS